MSLNFRLNTIRDFDTVCYQTRTFDTREEAEAFVRAETSYMGPNWGLDNADATGRTAISMSVTTNMLIWASMLVGLPTITEKNAEKWHARLAAVEARNGAYRTRDGEDLPFSLEEVKAHVGLSTNVSTETDTAFRAKVARWDREAARRAERAAS